MQYIFNVPPGIGDVSWCYQKLLDILPGKDVGFKVCNDKPLRSADFVGILPGVKFLGYGESYNKIKNRLLPTLTNLASLRPGSYNICMNPHLEAGNLLSNAFPQQRTHYRFPLATAPWVTTAEGLLSGKRLRIGFYCSSYAHRPDLGLWSADQWVDMLTRLRHNYPDAEFVALGADYDDKTKEVVARLQAAKWPLVDTVGTSHIGLTVELIKRLDYFVSFPSGLAILAGILDVPCCMWYWSNIPEFKAVRNFPYTYVDPEDKKSGRQLTLPYGDVDASWKLFVAKGARWVGVKRTPA